MKSFKRLPLATGICVAFAAAVGTASADSSLPAVKYSGSVAYQTGGIGVAEAQAMKSAAQTYPLTLEFVEQNGRIGEYSAGEQVTIQDAHNSPVLTAQAQGPFMLVDLPDGNYTVTASAAGHEEVRHIDLAGKPHDRIAFVWPANEVEPKA